MKKRVVLISISLLMTLPAAMVAAEKASQPGAGDQRAACDAQCRENYQNNSAAMQACLRDCGAVGPASPAGAKAPGHELTHTMQQSGAVTPPPTPAEGTTVKSSKSNSDNRMAQPSGAGAPVAEATTVKSSKSNSSEREAALDTGETPPAKPDDDEFKIGTEAGTTEADCTKKGGKVETGKDGAKWCMIASSMKRVCLVYQAGHQGDDRYCSQSVPAPQ